MRVRVTFTLLADSGEEIQPGTLFREPTQDIVFGFLEAAVDCVGEPVVRLEIAADLEEVPGGYDRIEVPLFEFVNRWRPVTKKAVHGGDRDPDHDTPATSI